MCGGGWAGQRLPSLLQLPLGAPPCALKSDTALETCCSTNTAADLISRSRPIPLTSITPTSCQSPVYARNPVSPSKEASTGPGAWHSNSDSPSHSPPSHGPWWLGLGPARHTPRKRAPGTPIHSNHRPHSVGEGRPSAKPMSRPATAGGPLAVTWLGPRVDLVRVWSTASAMWAVSRRSVLPTSPAKTAPSRWVHSTARATAPAAGLHPHLTVTTSTTKLASRVPRPGRDAACVPVQRWHLPAC